MMRIFFLCLFVVGCSQQPIQQLPVHTQTTIQDIPRVNSIKVEARSVPEKPKVSIQTVENQRVAVLDKKGMIDLYNLYSSSKSTVDERNKLVDALNVTIDERNKLLDLAKDEEIRANGLSKDLAAERQNRIDDQKQADRQLWITRISAGLLLGAGLVF